MDPFSRSWTALLSAVADLSDSDFARPSGCTGWLVRDLVCHLVIDAQDVLITLVTPSETEPTVDATSYWKIGQAPDPDDPLATLIPRLAAAYGDPALLKFHLDDVGTAAGRAATLADPTQRVTTQDEVLTTADFLSAYLMEWTLHHLDLIVNLPHATPPPPETLTAARTALERIAGAKIPDSLSDTEALRIVTGRQSPTESQREALGELAKRLPLNLG